MWPHRLIHDIYKPVLNSYIQLFFICKLDQSLCTWLIRIKSILMTDTCIHKNVIWYKKKHGFLYVNKYINNTTSLQMLQISLIIEKHDKKITVELIFCSMSTSTYLSCFSNLVHIKNCWHTSYALLKLPLEGILVTHFQNI